MRKTLVMLAVTSGVTFSLTGCSSSMSSEAACKEYFNQFGIYLAALMQGDSAAESKFSTALMSLADKSPSDLATALRSNAQNATNTADVGKICAPYLKG